MFNLQDLLAQLISLKSISPEDAGCQTVMQQALEKLGFQCQSYPAPPVSNLLATRGHGRPFFMFAGHTDVVPAGPLHAWHHDPFELTLQNERWYGRGVADMKGSLAAMIIATERWLQETPDAQGTIGFLITSGEEGQDFEKGTPYVMRHLEHDLPDYCVVGEPSSETYTGDTIKIGRRGSLSARLTITGQQGHVAYPHLAHNAIHEALPALHALIHTTWDHDDPFFPPTSLQITQIEVPHPASNVIPGTCIIHLNIRYGNRYTYHELQTRIESIIQQHTPHAMIEWTLNGEPFLTSSGFLQQACIESIQAVTGSSPKLSTSGGTSDGRFIAPYGIEVIELGPPNQTIHQINESLHVHDLEHLVEIYVKLLKRVFSV